MRRSLIVIGVGVVLAVSGGIGVATTSAPPGETPAAPTARVVPSSGQDLDASIAALQSTLRRLPDDHVSWANLAIGYVEQARITGNATYYEKADEAVARSFSIEPDENFTALAASAAISAARHDFSDALARADEALAINPRDLGALAIRVDALNELGRYDDQLKALPDRRPTAAEHGDRGPLLLCLRAQGRPGAGRRHPAPRSGSGIPLGQGLHADPRRGHPAQAGPPRCRRSSARHRAAGRPGLPARPGLVRPTAGRAR